MLDIVKESEGKWHGIYSSLGIEVGDGTHCPCPMCGGTDRFRMDNKDDRGTYYCNQCGAGDGFKLLQNVLGIEFKDVAREVESVIGSVSIKNNIPKEPKISKEKLRKIFTDSRKANKTCFVGRYLKERGISEIPKTLRYISKCYESETKKELPAMLAVFTSSDGEALTMHRTYLDKMTGGKADLKSPKKILPGLKKLSGGAIRLFEPENNRIAVAEGIETALAVNQLMNLPCWSVVSTSLMESFKPPKGIKEVFIMADNDRNFAGQKSAYILANRLKLSGLDVSVFVPTKVGSDFLDELVSTTLKELI